MEMDTARDIAGLYHVAGNLRVIDLALYLASAGFAVPWYFRQERCSYERMGCGRPARSR